MNSTNCFFGEGLEVTANLNKRILGVNGDYYIALGLVYKGQYEFPLKKFYYASSSNFEFKPIPNPPNLHKEEVEKVETMFTGKPDTTLYKEEQAPAGGQEGSAPPQEEGKEKEQKKEEKKDDLEDSVEVVHKDPPTSFFETDRLAYVICAIENDTHVVPEGAFKLLPAHEIRRNASFRGLEKKSLGSIDKYYHFRNVQLQEKKILIETNESIFHPDIFDPINTDLPKGAWSIQKDSSATVANIRSLTWPGYIAYHVANSGEFGGVYFGDGLKNKDLAFMI